MDSKPANEDAAACLRPSRLSERELLLRSLRSTVGLPYRWPAFLTQPYTRYPCVENQS